MHHDLKCIEPFFSDVVAGRKPFEIRKNDRNFLLGDTFTLWQFDPVNYRLSGEKFGPHTITYLTNYRQHEPYVVFSWTPAQTGEKHG